MSKVSIPTHWMSSDMKQQVEKFHNKGEAYMFYFYKVEHEVVRCRRRIEANRIKLCYYGQASKGGLGFYDSQRKVIYKMNTNGENSWIVAKFAVMIKKHLSSFDL